MSEMMLGESFREDQRAAEMGAAAFLLDVAEQLKMGKIAIGKAKVLINDFLRNPDSTQINFGDENQISNDDSEIKKENLHGINFSKCLELSGREMYSRTAENIYQLYFNVGEKIFGRTQVVEALGLTPSPASEFIKKLIKLEIIRPVKGYGKGKYIFVNPAESQKSTQNNSWD